MVTTVRQHVIFRPRILRLECPASMLQPITLSRHLEVNCIIAIWFKLFFLGGYYAWRLEVAQKRDHINKVVYT
jgi:hypothetical protein